jgi:diacylglycerol kinase family enzyme
MAGMGMDSIMIRDADRGLKDRLGRAAYVWTGSRAVRREPVETKIRVDGHVWFDGPASCVLVGNVGKILGGVNAFEHAQTDDGMLDLAVITAEGALQWARTLARAAFGHAEKSPLVQVTKAKKITVTTKKALPYEMDGGVREKTKELKVRVVPAAITVRVPPS